MSQFLSASASDSTPKSSIQLALLAAALGYFVDVYDIILFTAVRVPSLKALGLAGTELTHTGLMLLNLQLIGMVIGGFLWGMLGDRRGRVTVLFGSIILYSTANLLNAAVSDIGLYGVCRFFAGVGLAGELGAGITLVSEMMSTQKRGFGTMIIATCGVLGGIAGGLVGDQLSWRWAYFLGGLLGFGLLVLRWRVHESSLFSELQKRPVVRGSLLALIHSPQLLWRYLRCLALGAPIWILIGIFITLSPEIGKVLELPEPISAGRAILFYNVGFGLGDVGSSLLSQLWHSRKKAAGLFLLLTLAGISFFLSLQKAPLNLFYFACILLGAGAGYWAVFIMISAEQFGTNLRATVATSLPNLVRGLVVPISLGVQLLIPSLGLLTTLRLVGYGSLILAALSIFSLPETYGSDLDFVEDTKRA